MRLAQPPSSCSPSPQNLPRESTTTTSEVPRLSLSSARRLISLNLVAFQVHSMNERQLRVKMANGRKYYLQLCAPAGQEDIIFQRWLRLIYVLNVASGRISDPISFTSKQSGLHTIWKSASFRATPEKVSLMKQSPLKVYHLCPSHWPTHRSLCFGCVHAPYI